MKKFFMLLTSFTLLLALVLTGCDCSCSSTPALSFGNNFMTDELVAPKQGYEEKLTYSVNYDGDGVKYANLKKSSATDAYLEKDGIKYEGELTTTFKVGNVNHIPQGVSSDVLSAENVAKEKINEIYIFETELNLKATYNFKNNQEPTTVDDTVKSVVYFLPSGSSFAPIYSSYQADMHAFFFSQTNSSNLTRVKYDYKTTYTLEEFTLDKTTIKFNSAGEELQAESYSVTEEYDYKHLIDNNQLLFALRSFATSADNSTSLAVANPAYNEEIQTVSLSTHTVYDEIIDFLPGIENEKLPIRNFSMNLASSKASGANHYFTIQTSASPSIPNNCLLVKYAQPLFDYGTMNCMGALEFRLATIDING